MKLSLRKLNLIKSKSKLKVNVKVKFQSEKKTNKTNAIEILLIWSMISLVLSVLLPSVVGNLHKLTNDIKELFKKEN